MTLPIIALAWLGFLSLASGLGSILSPLGERGRRLRVWAETKREGL